MGGSSGGGGRTPIEAPESGRNKERVKIVEILSEGEIGGLVDELKSVFLDNTPVQAADGSYNFSNVEMEGRLGTQDQGVIPEFNAVEKEVAVGVEVKKTTPITRTVTEGSVNRIRMKLGVQALFEQNDQGDTNPTTVYLKITVGTREIPFTFNGKHSNPYSRAIEISDLPAVPFTIKVERITADSKSNRLANKTVWASYTEIIDSQFAYPNTAYAGVKFDSEYFSGIPTRTYEIYGIKVRVPSNYDPVARTYSGLWDGSFKIAYTNNPAWVLMDIVTNKRYGLGDRLGEFSVDKWALYQISQYCDQKIPDGFGGVEPRFTCNLWITEQRSAYDVLSDLCSIFRAIPVWNGTELTFIMDRPADPVWTYTNANVVKGEFSRQYSAMKARHNAIQVEYKDASNAYTNTIEYVSDDEAIRKFGLNLKKVTAYGCTSRGQAFRTGKWLLETERLETETVTFTVGSEGLMNIPGDIIRVTDNHYAGANIGGRVVAINGRTVTLDREITLSGNSYLSFINANAKHSNIKISAATGRVVTLDSVPTGLTVNGIWSLTTAKITSRLYRCMTITENSDEGTYTIVALQHEPQKEAIVDNSASFEPVNSSLLKTPTLESADVTSTINGGMNISWSTTSGVGTLTYDIKILKEDKLYAYHKGVSSTEFALEDLPDGNYTVVIIAKNASGQIVSEKSQTFTIDRPPIPTNVEVSGGLTAVVISWGMVNEATFTEIWASETNDIRTATRITKVNGMMYSHEVGARQVRYYWVRHTRGQNNGPFYQEQGLKAETGADIEAELALLNEKLSQNIIDEVFDTAMPARKLEMTKTVARIDNPTENIGHNQVYNEADGKLYIWDGSKYTAKVQAVDLEGKLASNQLDQALINQLNQAGSTANNALSKATTVQSALAQEVNQRTQAIQAETSARTQALQAEANARGTAVGRLEQVDREQAQLITTATAKADNALSGLSEERTARTSADEALGRRVDTVTATAGNALSQVTALSQTVSTHTSAYATDKQALTARIGNAESGISTTSQAVANLNGTVSAMHTIKTQTIAGGRTAIAGISMGTNGSESSVIVMADKFNVVKNAQDGNVKPMFSVVNNQVAVNGDLIADGTISARMMAANSVQAGTIQAGAINANHLQAGQISADKLAIGLGGNLLYNPIFANNGNGWIYYVDINNIENNGFGFNNTTGTYQSGAYLPTENQFRLQHLRKSITGDVRLGGLYQDMKLTPNTYYCFSAYVGGHRSYVDLNIEGGGVQIIHKSWSGRGRTGGYPNNTIDTGIENSYRIWLLFKTNATNSAETNYRLIINTWGQNGQDNPMFIIRRPMLEECTEYTKEPSPWQNSGVTAIHGGSIVTNTITAQQMAANTITANEIASGAIATRHLSANSVNAGHVVARTLTADKLNINSLSAISANLGTMTAGSIQGVTITGNTISGNTITGGSISGTNIIGTTITGGTITGARLEGATGRFTGELEVTQLIGGNIIAHITAQFTREKTVNANPYNNPIGASTYHLLEATINFTPVSTARYIEIIGVYKSTPFLIPANTSHSVNVCQYYEYRKITNRTFFIKSYAVSTSVASISVH